MNTGLSTPFAPQLLGDADFEAWWSAPGDYVETPNVRRGGWSGVVRTHWRGQPCYIKRQHNHLCRSPGHPFGWPTASREHAYLERVRGLGIAVPEVLFHGTRHTLTGTDAVLATRALTEFTPLSEQQHLGPERRVRLARTLGELLGRLHRTRLQHSCLYDKHIMVCWQGDAPRIALLDLEKMRYRLSRKAAAHHDLDQLRRHQHVWNDAEWAQLIATHTTALAA